MNVLHINSNYLTSRLHENLIEKTESNAIHNTIFMPIKEAKKEEFLYESKYEVYSPVTFKNTDKFFFTYKQKKIFNKLLQLLDTKRFDVVQAHTLFTDGYVAYQLYKRCNIPYMVTVRGHTDIKQFFKIRMNLRGIGRKILKNASKVVFLSESNRDELLEKYISNVELRNSIKEKSVVIPNGIDDFWFENEGHPKKINMNKPLRIIYVGKTMKLKNLLGTIQALNYLQKEKDIKSTYTAIGKTVEEKYADSLKKEIQVEYKDISATPREELVNYYRESDIFVMPSFSETFGLVYPEAMSQGLPVIYTRNQGFDGQFSEGVVGFSVNAKDSVEIAEKIMMIVDDYERISQNALDNYKKFNWNSFSEKYIELYKEIISEVSI